MKYYEKRKLIKYRENLFNSKYSLPVEYFEDHETEINMLEWLIASYEGRAGDPKEYLESLIDYSPNQYREYWLEMKNRDIIPNNETYMLRIRIREIRFLYNWIYYKQITGF